MGPGLSASLAMSTNERLDVKIARQFPRGGNRIVAALSRRRLFISPSPELSPANYIYIGKLATLEENVSRVERRRASRPKVPERPGTHISWSAPGRKVSMHATPLADRPAMQPLVFDRNLNPRLATVSVANDDTKPEDGHNPAQPACPRRDRTAKGRAAYPGRPPFPALNQSG
jgi:hypothetical protein